MAIAVRRAHRKKFILPGRENRSGRRAAAGGKRAYASGWDGMAGDLSMRDRTGMKTLG
jgi:hypothetical protein